MQIQPPCVLAQLRDRQEVLGLDPLDGVLGLGADEVVLLSGICGDKGYLQVGEPLEWMLTPESVGTFIQVGDDDPGVLLAAAGLAVGQVGV